MYIRDLRYFYFKFTFNISNLVFVIIVIKFSILFNKQRYETICIFLRLEKFSILLYYRVFTYLTIYCQRDFIFSFCFFERHCRSNKYFLNSTLDRNNRVNFT